MPISTNADIIQLHFRHGYMRSGHRIFEIVDVKEGREVIGWRKKFRLQHLAASSVHNLLFLFVHQQSSLKTLKRSLSLAFTTFIAMAEQLQSPLVDGKSKSERLPITVEFSYINQSLTPRKCL